MPSRPSKPCTTPGCPNPARPNKPSCAQCRTRSNRDLRTRRGNSHTQGYGRGHRDRFRVGVLTRDRLCRICKRREAVEADHYPLDRKTLVKLGLDANDPAYGRGLCKPCHSRATAAHAPGGWYRGSPW